MFSFKVERDRTVKLSGYLLFYWIDEFHIWNDTFPHACVSHLVVPQDELWLPEMALINS